MGMLCIPACMPMIVVVSTHSLPAASGRPLSPPCTKLQYLKTTSCAEAAPKRQQPTQSFQTGSQQVDRPISAGSQQACT